MAALGFAAGCSSSDEPTLDQVLPEGYLSFPDSKEVDREWSQGFRGIHANTGELSSLKIEYEVDPPEPPPLV